ncbi:KdsC family phosphatase [Thioflexithrix psekupsensis]|uniref:3-deoxy-D-manno-octulosonate 8-phosphate phosphatase KdsC n=1 Tax=Thioflexithrix psekupsensis TaxID=1570016 RepID=A0A251X4X2_9GAMM|nr:HAD-IIIA family hydrolase [Thioflexithrix psekupsensis]OUD12405.1 3-deoxy-D-manno-octulosonate 8-phosphate phosphatase [Thioflexithrix psekupsensis]
MTIPADILQKAAQVRLMIFDVDGVLTDGRLYLGAQGEEYKAFYARDGLGMKLLQASGVELAIITGRSSPVVLHRMESLDIRYVYQGQLQKLPALLDLCAQLQLSPTQVAYLGDDINDVPVLRKVGLPLAVGDAAAAILPYVAWQVQAHGGRGAAREVCELIMTAQGTLNEQLARYDIR